VCQWYQPWSLTDRNAKILPARPANDKDLAGCTPSMNPATLLCCSGQTVLLLPDSVNSFNEGLLMSGMNGLRVVVVGGGTGIGLSTAKRFSRAGASVAIGGRRLEVLNAAAAGTTLETHAIDVAERADVLSFFQWAREALGGEIDVLINAAGVNIKNRSMSAMSPEQWDQLLAINATGAYNCLLAVLPAMRERKQGTIVNISSVAGKRAIALGGVAYSASKFAMTALGTCVANEVAEEGVRVTNVYPGEVNTPILENRPTPVTEEHKQRILQPDDVAEMIYAVVALPPTVHVPELVIKPLSQTWY
jgi:NADP-dependent 3-hydroxy acid dehydrogenase YdfG